MVYTCGDGHFHGAYHMIKDWQCKWLCLKMAEVFSGKRHIPMMTPVVILKSPFLMVKPCEITIL
jgi:hypothetical protein